MALLSKELIEKLGEVKINEDYKLRDFMEVAKGYKDNTKFLNVTRLAEVLPIKKHNVNRREELRTRKEQGDESLVFVTKGAGGKMLVHPILLPTVLMAIKEDSLYLNINRIFVEGLSNTNTTLI